MIKKCMGCGALLQTKNKSEVGYINKKVLEKSDYCERCFKIMHYGEASLIDKKIDQTTLIKEINKTKYPVIYLVDLLTLTKEKLDVINILENNVYLVLTKKDLLPKSVKDKKIISYIESRYENIKNIFIVSSAKMYNIDKLLDKLKSDKVKSIYVIGFSNSGKSSLINSFLKSIGKISNITTSVVPNTTTENINISLSDNLTIIDTPGFINEKDITNFIDINEYKNLIPKKEIKPKIYVLKPGFMLLINNILRIENNTLEKQNLIFYLNNNLEYKKMKAEKNKNLKNLQKEEITLESTKDIVIEGLGFIKTPINGSVTIYTLNKSILTKRDKLI